jgi:2-methylcitrate dehydratase
LFTATRKPLQFVVFNRYWNWLSVSSSGGVMAKLSQNEVVDRPGASRRTFLKQVVATGAAAGAAVGMPVLPALAQEKTDRTWSTLASGEVPIAETLAQYAINLKYEDLPPEVARTAKRIVLDTLGCAIGGYSAGPSQIAIKLASEVSAKPGATVLCRGIKTSPDHAVFANGVMIRYLDFNDGYISLASGHPSDTIGALLTPCELMGRSGRDLITATVLTYEVFTKIVDVLDIGALGIDQSTVTGLAALVGAGKLMGLTQEQLVQAIGIFVGGNTAINQGRVGTLSNWKTYASAEACRKATFAIQLAQAGMTGPEQVFEGRDGFFNVISHKPFTLAKLGETYGIMHAFTKRFSLGQYAQTVAQAAVEARKFFKDPSEIQEVNIRVSHIAIRVMADSPDKWHPQTHETADHSMPYAAGVALMYGNVEDRYYEDPYLHDQRLLDLVSRVKIIPSEEADQHQKEFNLCDLEVVLKSGQRNSTRVDYHRGHYKNPMTDAEMEEKFRSLARRQLPTDKVDNLLKHLRALEDMPKAGDLVEMTKI